jgi:hypothetical protein
MQQNWPGWQQLLFCVQQVVPAAHAAALPQRQLGDLVGSQRLAVALSHAGLLPQRHDGVCVGSHLDASVVHAGSLPHLHEPLAHELPYCGLQMPDSEPPQVHSPLKLHKGAAGDEQPGTPPSVSQLQKGSPPALLTHIPDSQAMPQPPQWRGSL